MDGFSPIINILPCVINSSEPQMQKMALGRLLFCVEQGLA
jgi:hypothetical protein